jgi:flagellar motility protein MotE (MotC chaperone)
MSRMPRLLPIVGVAIAGVLAINVVRGGPQILGAAKAFAEDVTKKDKSAPPATSESATLAPKPAAPVCAPTASELAKEAGLSPAELQVLQSLGSRRGELDQRETDLDTQVQLIAAAEAKLDDRIKQMTGLKDDIQGLLGQADQQQEAETARLIRVYEAMKPKDAAGRMALMDDSVRLPMAAKMKERALSAILAQMAPEEAKSLTEKLAHRVSGAAAITNAKAALNPPAAQAAATPPPAPAPAKPAAPADAKASPSVGPPPGVTADVAPKPKAKPRHAAQKAKPKAPAKPTPKPAETAAAAGDTRAAKPKPAVPAGAQAQGSTTPPAAAPTTPAKPS